ncbi:GNAT family N-acetyltransferase [Sneathiella limimaris]|uniref:GNAT family N-acetyltransferase n=1 Tax=Sneathiella limimaris TaxID=1964213 RepID=UPI00146D0CF0|nr:N-acetyltransferase [Sneathiella limimaris]
MTNDIKISNIENDRSEEIFQLHKQEFPTISEANLVLQLENDKDVVLSLGATRNHQLIGHLVLSRMRAPFPALGMAPISIDKNNRRQGIASLLIRHAIKYSQAQNWSGIFVLGEPNFYQRFGFSTSAAKDFICPFSGPYFMYLPLTELPKGLERAKINYAKAFDGLA